MKVDPVDRMSHPKQLWEDILQILASFSEAFGVPDVPLIPLGDPWETLVAPFAQPFSIFTDLSADHFQNALFESLLKPHSGPWWLRGDGFWVF